MMSGVSRPRYDWWPYVKGMIRRYPELKSEYESLHSQTITQQLSGMPGHHSSANRSVESIALRELPTTRQREYEAVRKAIELTSGVPYTGQARMKIIELMYWRHSHNLEGAALVTNYSYRTARRFHSEFIMLVAKFYGLLDE